MPLVVKLQICEKLKIRNGPLQVTPSAFQIRFGGCKGVVSVWPGISDESKLQVRKSMTTFMSTHNVLEVIQWTSRGKLT